MFTALADSLGQLGISPMYHMREVSENKHQGMWVQAIEAKFENKGEGWGRQDFERILAGYEVCNTCSSAKQNDASLLIQNRASRTSLRLS